MAAVVVLGILQLAGKDTSTAASMRSARAPSCTAGVLRVVLAHPLGAAGTGYYYFEATDRSRRSCRLAGFFHITVIGRNDTTLTDRDRYLGTTPTGAAVPAQTIVIKPHETVTAGASIDENPVYGSTSCPSITAFAVRPLHATRASTIETRVRNDWFCQPKHSKIDVFAGEKGGPSTSGIRVSASDVTSLQMFTPGRGVGVAYLPAAGSDRLVRTSDGGRSWRLVARIPQRFVARSSSDVQMAFSSPKKGYLFSTVSEALLFTRDGGSTWSLLHPPGAATAISLRKGQLWVTSDFCPRRINSWSCSTRLLVYREGDRRPRHDYRIPVEGRASKPRGRYRQREATLLERVEPTSGLVEEGEDLAPSRTQSLLITRDSGRRWRLIADPCEGLRPSGLVVLAHGRWDLYCQLDEGMHQGPTRLYGSRDDGGHWKLIAEGNARGPNVGTIEDVTSMDFAVSGNRRILWLVQGFNAVARSTDGGRDWEESEVWNGGLATELVTAGPTEAWLPVSGSALYRTVDGLTWNKLG